MTPHTQRDRTTVRRGLIGGALVWALATMLLAAAGVAGGFTPAALGLQMALAAPFGGIVAAVWVWLAILLDVLAGEPPSRRRWLWALGLTVATAFLLPLVLAASLGAAV